MPIPMDKLEVTRLHGPPRCARPGPKREALLGQWQRMVQLEDSRLKASSLRSGENTSENILFFISNQQGKQMNTWDLICLYTTFATSVWLGMTFGQ